MSPRSSEFVEGTAGGKKTCTANRRDVCSPCHLRQIIRWNWNGSHSDGDNMDWVGLCTVHFRCWLIRLRTRLSLSHRIWPPSPKTFFWPKIRRLIAATQKSAEKVHIHIHIYIEFKTRANMITSSRQSKHTYYALVYGVHRAIFT